MRKNIFACLFSIHNTISLSRDEQVCLSRLLFERCLSHHRIMNTEQTSKKFFRYTTYNFKRLLNTWRIMRQDGQIG